VQAGPVATHNLGGAMTDSATSFASLLGLALKLAGLACEFDSQIRDFATCLVECSLAFVGITERRLEL